MIRLMTAASVLLCVLAVSCVHESGKGESSHFFSVKQGSRLVLNRALTIPPDQVSVYVQDGEVKSQPEVDFYSPNCKFELYRISEQQRRVEPDTFNVHKVVDERIEVSIGHETYAALGDAIGISAADAPQVYNYTTVMYLDSVFQPAVFRITCQHWEDVFVDKYLSIEQMRQAMGGVFTLELSKPSR